MILKLSRGIIKISLLRSGWAKGEVARRKGTMSCARSSITSQRELQNPFWFHLPLSRSLSDNFSGLAATAERHVEMDGSTVTSHLDSLNSWTKLSSNPFHLIWSKWKVFFRNCRRRDILMWIESSKHRGKFNRDNCKKIATEFFGRL